MHFTNSEKLKSSLCAFQVYIIIIININNSGVHSQWKRQ